VKVDKLVPLAPSVLMIALAFYFPFPSGFFLLFFHGIFRVIFFSMEFDKFQPKPVVFIKIM
jgi:hypothetical protein